MPQSTFAKEIINTLRTGNFYTECPCCGEEIALKKTGLFSGDEFSEEALVIYEYQLQLLRDRKNYLKQLRQKGTGRSTISAHATNIGFIMERIAPTMPGFRFKHNDCRAIFDPIDYIIFEGLTDTGEVKRLFFVDIKSGEAKLSKKQKQIRQIVQDRKITFKKF